MSSKNELINLTIIISLFLVLLLTFSGIYFFILNPDADDIIPDPGPSFPIPTLDIQTDTVPDNGIIIGNNPLPSSIYFSSDAGKDVTKILPIISKKCNISACNSILYDRITGINKNIDPDNMPKECINCPTRGFSTTETDYQSYVDDKWKLCSSLNDCYYAVELRKK